MPDSTALDAAVETFCQFIEDLPAEALVEQPWGPREVLAHLVYFHQLYVKQAQAFLADEQVDIPRGRYSDLNARAVEMYRGIAIPALLELFRESNRQLASIYATSDPQEVLVPIKSGVRPYPLAKLVPEVAAHVRNHRMKLARELRKTGRHAGDP